MNTSYFRTGAIIMALGVILGAMGAHFFETKISAERLVTYETAVRYQVYHAFAMLLTAGFSAYLIPARQQWILRLFLTGIILFSGSVYLLALRDYLGIASMAKILGPITPLGGMCFISGWILLAFSIKKNG